MRLKKPDQFRYIKWRDSILKRDRFRCKFCGQRATKKNRKGGGFLLQVHHIRKYSDYPALRYEISNGITLCKPCHQKCKDNEEGYERLCQLLLTKKSVLVEVGNLLREEERREEIHRTQGGE